jgi:hypothetical protein
VLGRRGLLMLLGGLVLVLELGGGRVRRGGSGFMRMGLRGGWPRGRRSFWIRSGGE